MLWRVSLKRLCKEYICLLGEELFTFTVRHLTFSSFLFVSDSTFTLDHNSSITIITTATNYLQY